ncbi:sigma-54 interaction domain-containing protein [Inmirania thermothiophila]|nr:sigma-54 dependent transcriptional regulator [Inmirania thermothiophila]
MERVLGESTDGPISRDPQMLALLRRIEQVAPTEATVLLEGESGTGKGVIARLIHTRSRRKRGPFVAVNCAAIPETLIEAELFGHVRGAFTGAVTDREGRFAAAEGGTLFLDEIGELPLHLQAKLLKVLQDRTYEPVGSSHSRSSDARVICATNLDLREAVRRGRFRADLYYRISVIPLTLPPLRERKGDIPLLIEHFTRRLAARGYTPARFTAPALRRMLDYPWPGNIRELENAVEHALICADGGEVTPEDLPQNLRTPMPAASTPAPPRPAADPEAERRRILEALHRCRGRRAEAARLLGIDRTTLWRRMRRLGLR